MEWLSAPGEVGALVRRWRDGGQRIAFVPTMGNLHDGHMALVRAAREQAERVVVSIFVNPLQFGPSEDLTRYPRTLEADAARLRAEGVDLLFTPAEAALYPHGRDAVTRIQVPGLSDLLCGAVRPGHFSGVATVVAKLFHIVGPDLSLFGEKDYQQLLVIRRMVEDLDFTIAVQAIPTVREGDGLAMSSRNGYLSSEERRAAPALYRALRTVAAAVDSGGLDYPALERQGLEIVRAGGLEPEYFTLCDAETLRAPAPGCNALRVLAAARLGSTRLIDNIAAGACT